MLDAAGRGAAVSLGQALPSATRLPATTPVLLRRCMVGLVVLAMLACGLSLWTAASVSEAARTIGRDAEPSVALALRMEATVQDMMAAMLADSLTDDGMATGTSLRFSEGLRTLDNDVVAAAGNITYGEAEAGPLRDLLQGVAMYQRAVIEVRAVGPGNAYLLSHRIQWADRVGRGFAVPAARALAAVNAGVLEQRYAAYRAASLLQGGAAVAGFVLLAASLLAVQAWLARRMRRIVNPPLAAATLVVVAAGGWFGAAVLTERADLRAAKADAYDSLSVLFQAKGVANALRSDMSLWLLDPAVRPEATARMTAAAGTLLALDMGRADQRQGVLDTLSRALRLEQDGAADRALAETPKLEGLLGTELSNITFGVAERQAATDSVRRLADAVDAIGGVQAMEGRRQHTEAVARWLDNKPGGGAAAFTALGDALDRTIAVNQGEFDRRVSSALGTASAMPLVAGLALGLVALLSVGGVWLRLREYR